jgi:hypothetical protein
MRVSHLSLALLPVWCVQAAVCLVADQGFTDINICYSSPRGDDLDTRLLRAMVIKGILEEITTARVNLVNADLLAKNRGLRISEVTVTSNGRWGLLPAHAFAYAVCEHLRTHPEAAVLQKCAVCAPGS